MKTRISLLFFIIVSLAIPAVGREPYYFIMLTDPQLGLYASNENFVQETANYEFAIATVNRLKPGFAIVLGDLVNKVGDEKQIREYLRISAKFPCIMLRATTMSNNSPHRNLWLHTGKTSAVITTHFRKAPYTGLY